MEGIQGGGKDKDQRGKDVNKEIRGLHRFADMKGWWACRLRFSRLRPRGKREKRGGWGSFLSP